MKSSLLDNIWIINLDKSTDRMEKIKKNFDSHKIRFNRFSAVYGKNVSPEYMEKNVSFVCKKFLCNYGIIGCAGSHKALWEQLTNSDKKYYIIFEDDVEINDEFANIINLLEPQIEKYNIDYLNLNCINTGCYIPKTEFTIGKYNFGKPLVPFQTNSYIITKTGATKLLNAISQTNYHVDFEILFVKTFGNLNYYSSNPPILNLTDDETTIGLKSKTLSTQVLELLGLKYLGWFLNVPILTINLFYQINILMILLLVLFVANSYKFKNNIIFWFIILELVLINLVYF